MLKQLWDKWVNPVKYQKQIVEQRLEDIRLMQVSLKAASKGIVPTSSDLYNFLTQKYVSFSLMDYRHVQGVKLRLYTPNSTQLSQYIEDIKVMKESQYASVYNRLSEHFPLTERAFGDWFDNEESINFVLQYSMPMILKLFLFTQAEYENDIRDDIYQRLWQEKEDVSRRYPGLNDFVEHADYRSLVSEVLNVLTALYTINLRSIGEIQ